nr:uncharacterized protein LOC107448964 [Parasteatoda tepidariorum]
MTSAVEITIMEIISVSIRKRMTHLETGILLVDPEDDRNHILPMRDLTPTTGKSASDELQHHVQSLPRGSGGSGSPCSTLQLLAKVKSSPIFDRCHGNQYLLRIPYQMYNVKGELRYIVQDPPNLEQCYLEASCSIPSDVCRNYGYPYGRRGNLNGVCESRHCHHTLLAWNPSSPDAGTFFDIFEYSCCCNCHYTTNTQTNRPQING